MKLEEDDLGVLHYRDDNINIRPLRKVFQR